MTWRAQVGGHRTEPILLDSYGAQSGNGRMPPHPNAAAVTERIAALSAMTNDDLRALWHEVFGSKVPFHAQKELLVFGIARRIQENAFGGLPKRLQKRLESLNSEPDGRRPPPHQIKPGTRLLREWRDDTHEVIVCDRSFTYRGQTYTSLSEIARLITGTRWSGPRFFGLKGHDRSEHLR